jgi:hypothetical protein
MAGRCGLSYRSALKRLADLEASLATLERKRPRTPGKKAAKTKALNKLKRQIPAAKGLVTKVRKKTASGERSKRTTKAATRQKRSDAAKRGWITRRARAAAQSAPQRTDIAAEIGPLLPFLTVALGVIGVWPPSKEDRSKIGRYWSAVDRLLANLPAPLDQFVGDSIFDAVSGQRLPFVTDPDTIYAYSDEYVFGLSFYRDRREYAKLA